VATACRSPQSNGPLQIRQFQEWFDSVLAGNTGGRTRLLWGPSGTRYQPFKEAPYKDEFDEWLARLVCYAFSLPATPFIRQMNRATADTAQQAALAEGLAPLMGWVKRLADDVIQQRLGHPDLEFAWVEEQAADPAEQATVLQTYVAAGIYTIDEARAQLGLDPVPGTAAKSDANPAARSFPGNGGERKIAASGDPPCQGGYCESGGSYGSTAMYHVLGRNVCRDCAVKMLGLDNEPAAVKTEELNRRIIGQ
jgi:Phage portal protein